MVANLSPCSLNQFLLLLAKYLSEVCRWSSKAYQASLPQSSNSLVGVGFPIGKRVLQDLDLKFATPERLSDLSILQQTLRIKFRLYGSVSISQDRDFTEPVKLFGKGGT